MKTDFSDIRCIAFDLDNTVLSAGAELSERTRAAFAAAQEKGIALLPVSGRAFSTLPDWIRETAGITYVVTSNGAVICDVQTGERVREWLLPAQTVRNAAKSIGSFFLEGQVSYEAFIDGIPYAAEDYVAHPTDYGIPQTAAAYIQQTRRPIRFIIDFVFENAKKMDSLDLILKDPGLYRMIENTIRNNAKEVYITSSLPYRMELSAPGSGKAPGMCAALELLSVSPEETLAFGDGDNDADMLAAAGYGVAVQNATDSCRESADEITDLPVGEDGVADFIEKNVL